MFYNWTKQISDIIIGHKNTNFQRESEMEREGVIDLKCKVNRICRFYFRCISVHRCYVAENLMEPLDLGYNIFRFLKF